jgi:hypothetical protein
MLSIKVRSAAEAQAIFDAVRGPRTWVEPNQCRGWHHVIAQTAKREDVEALLSGLRIHAKVREM